MKKKIISLVLSVTMSLGVYSTCLANDVSNESTNVENDSQYTLDLAYDAKAELKELFPNLKSIIEAADLNASTSYKAQSEDVEKTPIYSETKNASADEEVTITIYSDGSYASRAIHGSYQIKGNSSSGSGYQNMTNATVAVVQSLGLYQMTISPISYTLVNGGYDEFTNVGWAAMANNQYIKADDVKMKENSSGPARSGYYGTNLNVATGQDLQMTVYLYVGSDTFKVYLNGYKI